MEPLLREAVTEKLRELKSLDDPAKTIQKLVGRYVPQDRPLKDLLSGTWLGHPLHPLLTDVVVGCWTSAFLLDLLPGKRTRDASDRLVGLGILAAAPTAVAGLSDWADLGGGDRRIGLVHAAGNVTAVGLYTLSYVARKRGRRVRGILLSWLGMGVSTGSAYLGGHLTYGIGVGVNQTAFEEPPRRWTPVMDDSALAEGKLASGKAGDVSVMLARRGGRVFALVDRCSHRGCPLSDGTLNDGTVTCECHGSTFRLEDGTIVRGPATSPQPSFEVRTKDGKIEVRLRAD